jgi:hypothetical protein
MRNVFFLLLLLHHAHAQTLAWTRELPYETCKAQNIAVSNDDQVYVSGYYQPGSSTPGFFLHRYDQSGNLVWQDNVYTGVSNISGGSVVLDHAQKPYLFMFTYAAKLIFADSIYSGHYKFLAKYDETGIRRKVMPLDNNYATLMRIDKHDMLYLAGSGKYDTTGKCQFQLTGTDIGFDTLGNTYNIYLSGSSQQLRKSDKNGKLIWTRSLHHSAKVAVHSSGNVYVMIAPLSTVTEINKLDTAGNTAWTRNVYLGAHGIFIHGNNIYFAGVTATNGIYSHMDIMKCDTELVPEWSYHSPLPVEIMQFRDVVEKNDHVYALAWLGSGTFTAQLMKIARPGITITSHGQKEHPGHYINVIPNPSQGQFAYSAEPGPSQTYNLEVRDAIGRLVFEEVRFTAGEKVSGTLNLAFLAAGVYQLVISSTGNPLRAKIILR